ncbi:MAG: thiamine phosphate synthase [Limnochordaceae bacterium]|nr:thiamine phosphate synthase [Limnochordaceae bacterium]
MTRLGGLYLVVDPGLAAGPWGVEGVLQRVGRALAGGVDLVQLWAPSSENAAASLSPEQALRLATGLRALTLEAGVPLLIGEDVRLAARLGADGVHLEGNAPAPAEVRSAFAPRLARLQGRGALVGYTCGNDLEKVRWASRAGADYVSFCSVFPTTSAVSCELVPLASVRAARALEPDLVLFASGGITPGNAGDVLDAGADGIAVVSAVLKAPDPQQAARDFQELLRRRGRHRSGCAV